MCWARDIVVGSAFVGFIAIGSFPTAHAEVIYETAAGLNGTCTSDKPLSQALCMGFIGAELEIITNAPIAGVAACVPPLTTVQHGVEVAKKWLASHPEDSLRAASSVVAQAFAAAFPCKK